MSEAATTAITYTGNNKPFVDRIYGTGLTFMPDQTRTLPEHLAKRFLRHADVFEKAKAAAKKATAKDDKDDTAAQLAAAAAKDEEKREHENARFALDISLDGMDKAALRDFVKVNYKQDLLDTLAVAEMRAQAKGLVDQFGMP